MLAACWYHTLTLRPHRSVVRKVWLALDVCQDLLKSRVGVGDRDFVFVLRRKERRRAGTRRGELLPQFQAHLLHLFCLKFLAVYWWHREMRRQECQVHVQPGLHKSLFQKADEEWFSYCLELSAACSCLTV